MVKAYAMRAVCHAAEGDAGKAKEDTAAARQLAIAASVHRQTDRPAAEAFCRKARLAMEGGGLVADALYYLQKAIDADPGFEDAYDVRSDVYFNLGMADECPHHVLRLDLAIAIL